MFNLYKEGFESGFNDALDQKEKDYRQFSVSNLLSSKAQETYAKGYDSGYNQGQRESNKQIANEVDIERIKSINDMEL